ncbi:uncharacterized protein Z519_12217 [Cladophialophora bantiana CBS 173.52]|uniref:Cytochrome P450 n=1 Tax=Cladophialophora bantiana (strain ATCC 10958 / CBS 173.52 / CDC B-1940 / NIH 8579) TaxID=1442370 RepID=A0A0D2EAH2_CLAB1|nr:uncharacterized protein Z519_12217 [Cladophialophora bantiana CBS 173.52]KIW87106.1 hypothetical protein Z519_12217 [Cladophialophora bantiana CBS 173.52]
MHPLRKVPGPFLAKLTSKWLEYKDHSGVRTATLHEMHKKYGPVVRIAPNEVLFSNPAVIKKIYGFNSSYMKTAFYSGFEEPGRPVLFTLRDKMIHRDRRKLMAHAFTQSTISAAEPLVAEQVRKFIGRVTRQNGAALNVYAWFRSLTLDVVSSLFLGEAIGALDQDKPHEYMNNIDAYFQLAGLKWQLPWLLPLTWWIPLSSWQHFQGAQRRVYNYGRAAFKEYIERYGRDSGRDDPLKKIIHGDKDLPPLSDEQICCEVGSVLVAGTDTTATVLTYTAWELAVNSGIQSQLREELKTVKMNPGPSGVPRYSEIESLPLLDGIVLEGLRLHGPAVASLPRQVPAGGDMIDGYFIPGETTVSMQAYTVHHNENIFPDADTFKPGRWADGGTQQMRDASLQWSKGSRMCPGLHLATMELKMVLASLVLGWTISVGERMEEDTMDMVDHFVLMPKGNFCDLVFEPLKP